MNTCVYRVHRRVGFTLPGCVQYLEPGDYPALPPEVEAHPYLRNCMAEGWIEKLDASAAALIAARDAAISEAVQTARAEAESARAEANAARAEAEAARAELETLKTERDAAQAAADKQSPETGKTKGK